MRAVRRRREAGDQEEGPADRKKLCGPPRSLTVPLSGGRAGKDPRRWSERRAVPRLIEGLWSRIAAGGTLRPAWAIQIFRKLPKRSRAMGMGFPGGFSNVPTSTLPPCAYGLPGCLAVLLALPPLSGSDAQAAALPAGVVLEPAELVEVVEMDVASCQSGKERLSMSQSRSRLDDSQFLDC
jgi:hypothetical protein